MQATVLTFEPATGAGSVVLDSGVTLPFDADAFIAGGLRLLRPGQRVRLQQAKTGELVSLTVSTLADPAG